MNFNRHNKTLLTLLSLFISIQSGLARNANFGFDQTQQYTKGEVKCEVQCISVCDDFVIDYVSLFRVGNNDFSILNNLEAACKSIMKYKKCGQSNQQLQSKILAEFEVVYTNGVMHLVSSVPADENSCY